MWMFFAGIGAALVGLMVFCSVIMGIEELCKLAKAKSYTAYKQEFERWYNEKEEQKKLSNEVPADLYDYKGD